MVGDSLLWAMEGSICRPDLTCREVCCLLGAHIRDIARKVPGLVCPSDYCPLLIVQVGSDEIAQGSLQAIKKDIRALGQMVEGVVVYVLFSSLILLGGEGYGVVQEIAGFE